MTDARTKEITHALRREADAAAAVEALRGANDRAAVEGLVELLGREHGSRAGVAAVAALEECSHALAADGLAAALESPHAPVRGAAARALHRRGARGADPALGRLLLADESWPVRRAALRALADGPDPVRWQILAAAADPHWRVRHALIQVLLRWGEPGAAQEETDRRLTAAGDGPRVEGIRAYLAYRWSGSVRAFGPEPAGPAWPFWDWDPAVLVRNLERMTEPERREALGAMPHLLAHDDERVRAAAAAMLRSGQRVEDFAAALAALDEPRGGAAGAVAELLARLNHDQAEAVARHVLHLAAPSPAQLAWALDQAGVVFPPEEEQATLLGLLRDAAARPLAVRAALARLAGRWERPESEEWLRSLLDDPDDAVRLEALRGLGRRAESAPAAEALAPLLAAAHAPLRAEAAVAALRSGVDDRRVAALAADPDVAVRVRLAAELVASGDGRHAAALGQLQADPHPHVRAAALTPSAAEELVRDPGRETSWHVLAAAARLARVPLWKLGPTRPWRPEAPADAGPAPLRVECPSPPGARLLGPDKVRVTPLGVSGHYGLPVEGFVRAAESGVNLFFWEPNYHTLTEFAGRLSASSHNALHFVCGTFEADGPRVRRDAERALRALRVERAAVFLLFWVRSWARVSDDVRAELERLKAAGKVAAFGLSTHVRSLAVEALAAGWDPVMVRHSAAHRGAEEHIFPAAMRAGVGLLTFNNTCYGRLLKPAGAGEPPTAADCYRYALAQPGVAACWSAPATLEQLDENLAALRDPALPDDRRERLRAHGDRVYAEDTTFRRLVRSR
jgi:HEAT repeat protein